MTAQSSFTSTESDDFLKVLEESLVEEYSSHIMPNYVSDLMKSVNSVECVEQGYFFCDNDNVSVNDYFRKSPSLFSHDSDTDMPWPENFPNSIDSEKHQENRSVDMFSEQDQEDQQNTVHNGQNENLSEDFQMIEISSKSERQDESVSHVECLLNPSTSISVCTSNADDTNFRDEFETSKINNQQIPYMDENASSIISIDTCIADNSTYRDAYENWISTQSQEQSVANTLIYQEAQSISSISTDFEGFSSVAYAVKRAHMECSSRIADDSEGDDNTTHCEIYEQWIRTTSQTEENNFNLEEAYARCFFGTESVAENSNSDRRKTLMNKIEKLTLKVINDLKNGCKLKVTVPNKLVWSNCMIENERLKPLMSGASYTIQSKRKLAMVMFVLSIIYKLLLNNMTCTKREIYYKDPEFTQSQINVDLAIRDICIILNAPPWELGIFSSSKGLIAGSIKITLHDDQVIDIHSLSGEGDEDGARSSARYMLELISKIFKECTMEGLPPIKSLEEHMGMCLGLLLPHSTTSIKKVETSAAFVLLVEKHTIYERLLNENVLTRLGKSCILITGKGYPDINTRVLLKRIWDDCKCPIYALVDADPYGIEIMLIYRHGSLSMAYNSEELTVPSIRWIGVYPSEIKSLGLPNIPLTGEDVRRIDDIIKRPYISKNVHEELLVMKTTMQKTEVEALTVDFHDLIEVYLLKKIESGIAI